MSDGRDMKNLTSQGFDKILNLSSAIGNCRRSKVNSEGGQERWNASLGLSKSGEKLAVRDQNRRELSGNEN